jgi:starvation-inducible DNA-binding protein
METLIQQLRLLQANAFVYYTKAHGYHWNTEGILFNQFHDFFSEIYNDAWNSIDGYAEWIRIFGQYADFDAAKAVMTSNVKYDLGNTNNPTDMLKSLVVSNERIIEDLKNAFNMANIAGEQGVANFFADRIAVHEKFRWKMVSSLKTIINNQGE